MLDVGVEDIIPTTLGVEDIIPSSWSASNQRFQGPGPIIKGAGLQSKLQQQQLWPEPEQQPQRQGEVEFCTDNFIVGNTKKLL